MTSETVTLDLPSLERLISQVRGVQAVRIVAPQNAQIEEVHVVGTPRRSAKSIVRDIESIMYVRGGIRLDHRKISLVQIDDVSVNLATPRLRLLEVQQNSSEESTSVTVLLGLRELQVHGVGSSRPQQPADLPLLAAYATIHALNSLLGPQCQLQLERLQRQPFGNLEVYLANVVRDDDGLLETLLGISVLRDDELLSVSRAVLDAANRAVERALAERPQITIH
jgi:hypothetical protein